jgi:hypothetical protein
MRSLSMAVAILALPSIACAQVRAGVPLETLRAALGADALVLGDVDVPDAPDLPVRLAIQRRQEPVAILDVYVADTHQEARAWVAGRAPAISSAPLIARADGTFADTPSGPASLVIAAHANVAIVVRASATDVDAAAIAAQVGAAIDSAPEGAARISVPAPPTDDLAIGASRAVQLPASAVAARVVASGGGYARRTPRGWMITRTSADPVVARVLVVDRHLRVSR